MRSPEMEGSTMDTTMEVVEIGGDYGISAPESDNLHPFAEFLGCMPPGTSGPRS